ncbi:hypothetical protein LguiB_024102 [Lonicera macranthoides]
MNFVSRAFAAAKLARSYSSSHSPRKKMLVLYPIAVQQQHSSSLYSSSSSSSTRFKNSKKPPKTEDPLPPAPSQPSISLEKKSTAGVDWPRPSEIPWQAKVANSVSLIGHVQIPVQFQASPHDGKYFAGTVIAQQEEDVPNSSHSSPFFWIPVIFEGDLAHIAACHLKKNDFVHIYGQLSVDPPPFTLTEGQANVQVMVQSINYVQGSSPHRKTFTPRKQEELPIKQQASVKDEISVDQSLKDLITKPHEWWDIRSMKKGNSTAAAYEHKNNGKLVWIDESTPEWILKKLECLTFDCKIDHQAVRGASKMKDGESSWRDLLKNSKQWCDHRENKLNGLVKAKFPDFKHKESGAALWLNTAPQWVLPGLEGLEFDVPPSKTKQLNVKKGADEDSWKNLVENPCEWWDNRSNKLNARAPDFKHKDTGKALWLSDSPEWALSKLPPLKADCNDETA